MSKALDWVYRANEVAGRRVNETHDVGAEDRAELARMLDILSCDALKVSFALEPLKNERFRLSGTIDAQVTQACIVTLEPVPSSISEQFSVELYPALAPPEEAGGGEEQEVLSSPDIEPYEDGRIDVGAIVYEVLSAALDPYPRKEGVEFDWVDPKIAADPGAVSPFAALAKLKPKS
jgi:uncharacterized metal-binding protein YceD (DUF177 family)